MYTMAVISINQLR